MQVFPGLLDLTPGGLTPRAAGEPQTAAVLRRAFSVLPDECLQNAEELGDPRPRFRHDTDGGSELFQQAILCGEERRSGAQSVVEEGKEPLAASAGAFLAEAVEEFLELPLVGLETELVGGDILQVMCF